VGVTIGGNKGSSSGRRRAHRLVMPAAGRGLIPAVLPRRLA
jgi:hypothetical protein